MGERLLVHGAAGGVGTAAVLLGALAGATVVATVRDEAKRAAVEALAPGVWAIPQDGFEQHGPFDVILELVGAPNLPRRRRRPRHRWSHLDHRCRRGRQGRGEPARPHGQAGSDHGVDAAGPPARAEGRRRPPRRGEPPPALEDGRLRLPVDRTFPMAEATAAYEHFATGGKVGKVVLLA